MERPSYVLPLRWRDDAGLEELTSYLRRLAGIADVIVVDGSPPDLFERHRRAWGRLARHVPPDPHRRSSMGKVDGVMTGVTLAETDKVMIADDDVRYEASSLARVVDLLEDADLVWPQNYFHPMPWHARWDTARSLLNRAFSYDYPGTVGVRRSVLLAAGGYDGDVMFENLELRRTIEASGGRIATPLDLYVRRLPPATRHFLSQRVRQAYDDIALPMRLAAFLAVAPALAVAAFRGRLRLAGVGAAGLVVVAEVGRRRAGGREVFPATSALWAPAWVAERAITSWIALWERFARGGVRYGPGRIRSPATPRRVLRRRFDAAHDAQTPEERAPLICSA